MLRWCVNIYKICVNFRRRFLFVKKLFILKVYDGKELKVLVNFFFIDFLVKNK